jgi:hypothetical protein
MPIAVGTPQRVYQSPSSFELAMITVPFVRPRRERWCPL